MNKISLILMLVFVQVLGFSQIEITSDMLSDMHNEFVSDAHNTVLMNAVSANDINKLALSNENLNDVDTYFSDKVKTSGITNQESSGRCWLFTGLNVIRPVVMEKNNLSSFYFSNNYSFFYDQLEKSNLFLEAIIQYSDKPLTERNNEWLLKNALSDGGAWSHFVNVVEKYGVVPSTVMPETYHSNHTAKMSSIIKNKLRTDAVELRAMLNDGVSEKKVYQRKTEMLSEVYKMLSICLGEPPTQFDWRMEDKEGNISESKTYTPLSFYNEYVGVNLSEFVMIMNDPTRPYYKTYEIEYDRNTWEGVNWIYINLPMDEVKELAVKSIKDNQAMYLSCDVGKYLNKQNGVLSVDNYNYDALFGIELNMDKNQRVSTFQSGSSHAMTLMAVDIVDEKPIKWMVENSWGPSYGYNGYLIMTDKWIDEYLFRLVVNKKYFDAETLKYLDQEPTLLPPWDPMYKLEE